MAKPEPLYVTDAEIAARIGISLDDWKDVAAALEKAGLPAPEPLFRGRRYWPACKAFLDRRYGLGGTSVPPTLDGAEHWDG